MKIIKSSNLEATITKTTNNFLKKGFAVKCNSYYLRMIIKSTTIEKDGYYINVEDDYLNKIKKDIIKMNEVLNEKKL